MISRANCRRKSQGLFGVLPEYRIVKQEGEEHKKVFTAEVYINGQLYGSGTGKSKKECTDECCKRGAQKINK